MKPAVRNSIWIVLGGVLALALAGGVALAILELGVVDFSADQAPGKLESTLAPWALDRSIDRHGGEGLAMKNPLAGKPEALAAGLPLYRDNCMLCHSAPGAAPRRWSRGLNPPPPKLSTEDAAQMPDGEMFYIIQHGVRMTAMPSFDGALKSDQIWEIIAFVKHLRELGDDEVTSLTATPSGK